MSVRRNNKQPLTAVPLADVYRLLVREIRDYAIIMLDPKGVVMTWNVGAERLNGYAAEEIIGSHFSRFYTGEDVRTGKADLALKIATRDGRFESEGWRLRKDGSVFWANAVISALYDDHGFHQGFAKITRDLTERKRADEALRGQAAKLEERVEARTAELAEINKQLAEANQIKDDFLATLSHELRTPLTSAFGWLQMLRTGALDSASTQKAIDVLDRNLRAQIRMIDDLLNITQIVAGKVRLELREVDAVTVVNSALDTVRPRANQKGVELRFTAPSTPGSIVLKADPIRLQQIVWNLLTNAVKFTPAGGHVEVALDRFDDFVVIRVTDTGAGIKPEFLPHVFERFRQEDGSLGRKHGGLGIGLAVVRELVELHGGTVSVESQGEGKGATFKVSLPSNSNILIP